MRHYRTCLADAYAIEDVLRYLCSQIETLEEEAERHAMLLKEEPDSDWRKEQMEENVAKAAAFERIIDRLTKK